MPDADEAALSRRFLELFTDAVRTHLMSDVSLGAFLSGGVDSSLVVALMSECTSDAGQDVHHRLRRRRRRLPRRAAVRAAW